MIVCRNALKKEREILIFYQSSIPGCCVSLCLWVPKAELPMSIYGSISRDAWRLKEALLAFWQF